MLLTTISPTASRGGEPPPPPTRCRLRRSPADDLPEGQISHLAVQPLREKYSASPPTQINSSAAKQRNMLSLLRATLQAARGIVGELYRIELAPFAQGSLRGFRFEIVPALEHVSSYDQGPEFLVGASFAEGISDLIEVIRQKFARKVQRQRLAESELPFAGDCNVFLIILDIIRQLIIEFFEVGKFRVEVDLARPPAQVGLMQAGGAVNEFECEEYFLKAGGHPSTSTA